jgi:hypothetical protein
MNLGRISPIHSIHFFSIEGENLNQIFLSAMNASSFQRRSPFLSRHVSFNYRCRHRQRLEEKRSSIESKGSDERNVYERIKRRRNQFSLFFERLNFSSLLFLLLASKFDDSLSTISTFPRNRRSSELCVTSHSFGTLKKALR